MTNFEDLLGDLGLIRYHPQARRGSYDYTDPTDYVSKADRPGTTGEYQRDSRAGMLGVFFGKGSFLGATTSGGRPKPKSAKRRRGSGR